MAGRGKVRLGGLDPSCHGFTVMRIQSLESRKETINIGWLPRVNQVEIKRGNGRALQRGANATDHNEVNLVLGETAKDGQKIRT